MREKSILIKLSSEEIEEINSAYKKYLIAGDLVSRSEFLRRLIKDGLKAQ